MTRNNRYLASLAAALVLVLALLGAAGAEVAGDYEMIGQGTKRKLTIAELKGCNQVHISLAVQEGNFSGNLFGLADLKGDVATYKTQGCRLTITFSGHKAVISGANAGCRDYLKPGLLLDGAYIKK